MSGARKDYCTAADLGATTTVHTDLQWKLDLNEKSLSGVVIHTVKLTGDVTEIGFDSKGCIIAGVQVELAAGTWSDATFAESERAEAFGNAVKVTLPSKPSTDSVRVKFTYRAAPNCAALDWLSKEQTMSKELPFMYSQCEPINARSMFPCQDSPSVRMTYTATVEHDSAVTVLMSALPSKEESSPGRSVFRQDQPITPYLVAIAAGRIEGRDLSERCRVYSEPPLLDACATEFAEVETLLKTAEEIAGPYRWKRYDFVVLPPSFPYGGMENPNLTFVTPSIVCGDKSGVDVVAHEICHSWSGNLVGTATWSDFFLNEGFTMLLQRKIAKRLYGRPFSEFEAISGRRALEETIRGRGEDNPFTALRPDLSTGADPEEIFSTVPYEKGYALLRAMESVVGEDGEFDNWLKSYFNTFERTSITAFDMQAHFEKHFANHKEALDKAMNWSVWYTQPGLPTVDPNFDTSNRQETLAFANAVLTQNTAAQPEIPAVPASWRGGHHTAFLEDLRNAYLTANQPISDAVITALDKAFGYNTTVVNNEVLCGWFQLCLLYKKGGQAATVNTFVEPMKKFLASIGRMKFVRPLYRAWYQVAPEDARKCYEQCEPLYHNIARKMLRFDLALAAPQSAPGM